MGKEEKTVQKERRTLGMNKLCLYILTTLLLGFSVDVLAQPYKTIKGYKPYKWMFGMHWNAVEDDGSKFQGLFNTKDTWNAMIFPTKFTADRYFNYGWSLEMEGAYNRFEDDKTINDSTGLASNFASFDLNVKYSFYSSYNPRARWIDPYFTFGAGYTYRDNANVSVHSPSVNLGGGLNFWIKNWGLQIASQAKLNVWPGIWDANNHESYLHHSVGIVYRTTTPVHTNGYFGKKKYGWAKKSKRYKKKKGH